jgi:hypothetical protein
MLGQINVLTNSQFLGSLDNVTPSHDILDCRPNCLVHGAISTNARKETQVLEYSPNSRGVVFMAFKSPTVTASGVSIRIVDR